LVPKHDIGQPIHKVHAQKIAEKLGNKIVTNIVMIGAATAIFDLLKHDAMRESVVDSVPKKFIELNKKAFDNGFEAGTNARKEL